MNSKIKTAFERVQTARHPERPYTLDLLSTIFDDFVELHGDRRFADDPAMICGFAKLDEFEVAVVGQQKGRDLNQRRHRNFGMSKPEGYRKALRIMNLAEKFNRPIITFVDTPGAYPGIDAVSRSMSTPRICSSSAGVAAAMKCPAGREPITTLCRIPVQAAAAAVAAAPWAARLRLTTISPFRPARGVEYSLNSRAEKKMKKEIPIFLSF